MKGLGTIINVIAVLAGGGIGLVVRGGMKQRYQDIMMQALGMATIFVGIVGALQGMLTVEDGSLGSQGTLLLVLSLTLGGLVGEFLNIEEKLEQFGEWLKQKVHAEQNARFVEAFVTTSLVICVGAMAIVGALEDGLNGDANMLIIKSALDFAIVIVFASTLGVGSLFSAIPIAIWEGGITLAATLIAPFLSDALITDLSAVGSVLIFGVGVNLLFDRKIRVGNLLPALLGPVLYHIIL
ncbi:MAG: DUF554 domain-containing protein [Lachnospiraceae bacterium]|nr:DUF554 domain-containing protein [Lachnospiraceae bacterium]